MAERKPRPAAASKRMASYRERMRAAGLRPLQIWVPDTKSPDFAAKCLRQSLAIAQSDPDGAAMSQLIEDVADWS